MADGVCFRRAAGEQFGQMRNQIVAAALEKLGGQVRRPVRAIDLKRVGKDRIGRLDRQTRYSSGSATSRRCSSMAAREK